MSQSSVMSADFRRAIKQTVIFGNFSCGDRCSYKFFVISYANPNLICIAFQLKDDQAKGIFVTISYANSNLIRIAF